MTAQIRIAIYFLLVSHCSLADNIDPNEDAVSVNEVAASVNKDAAEMPAIVCRSDTYPPKPSKGAPRAPSFVIDLDAPPRDRWRHIVQSYVHEVRNSSTFIYKMIGKILPAEIINGLKVRRS